MSKIIGLTGGIGSGKTTVGTYLSSLGIPVYIADEAGRRLLQEEPVISQVRQEFGDRIIESGKVRRDILASIVFSDEKKLQALNAIIHPAVQLDFQKWLAEHSKFDIVVKESAILFETGYDADCDYVVAVAAPAELRIQRVMDRDNVSRESVLSRISNQWPQEEISRRSDFVIENSTIDEMHRQVNDFLKKMRNI